MAVEALGEIFEKAMEKAVPPALAAGSIPTASARNQNFEKSIRKLRSLPGSGEACVLCSGKIFGSPRVDLDLIANVDEKRHLNRGARLNGCGLGRALRGVAREARLRLRNLKLDK